MQPLLPNFEPGLNDKSPGGLAWAFLLLAVELVAAADVDPGGGHVDGDQPEADVSEVAFVEIAVNPGHDGQLAEASDIPEGTGRAGDDRVAHVGREGWQR
jgi:hypothetical protein